MITEKLKKFRSIDRAQKTLIIIAVKELALARLYFSLFSTETIFKELEKQSLGPGSNIDKSHLHRIAMAIDVAAANVPWRADCMIKVIAANRWLRRLGVASHFKIGVRKDMSNRLIAHAWLNVGDSVFVGGDISGYGIIDGSGDPRSEDAS